MAGLFAFVVGVDHVVDENQSACCLKDGSDADDEVQSVPAAAGFVSVDPSGHAEQTGDVHEVEREVKADEEEPEVPLAERVAHHLAGDFGIPVVEGAEEREDDRSDEHVVEVGDDKVGGAELPVERSGREHDAGKTGDEELEEEADHEHHGDGEDDLSSPDGSEPVEDLDSGGHRDDHGGEDKEGVAGRAHPNGKHVVRPHAEADEADRDRCRNHGGVSEHGFAGEDGDDLVGEGEGWENEDIHLGMAEDPEEVHPENCGATGLGIEEVRAKIAVEREHDLCCGKRTDGDKDEAGHDEIEPGKQRHAAHLHALAAHADDGGYDVECGSDASYAAEEDGQRPVVGAVARREYFGCQRSVGEPADVGCRACSVEAACTEVAEVQEDASEGGDPEAEGVQSGESHVARADHERDEIVSHAEEDGHSHEEDHGGAVHGKELVEDLG